MTYRNPILRKIDEWNLDPKDILWAIYHGASKPNDRRSRQLQGAAQAGGSRLKPYAGEWVVHRKFEYDGILLSEMLEQARKVCESLLHQGEDS